MFEHITHVASYGSEDPQLSVRISTTQRLMHLPSLETGFILETLLTVMKELNGGT